MANTNFTPTPSQVQPSAGQAPNGSWLLNPQGSPYAGQYNYNQSLLIKREIQKAIYDAIPAQFKVMRLLLARPMIYKSDDVFTYLERTWHRTALKASAGVGGGATQSIVLTAGGTSNVSINDEIVYPDNTHGIVTSVVPATSTITVAAQTGEVLPAVSAGDLFVIQDAVIADGLNFFSNYSRMTFVERTNYIQLFRRNKRWTRMEIQKHKNAGNTDYYEKDMNELMEIIYNDAFATFINGKKGEFSITVPGTSTSAGRAKTADGIFPMLQRAGVQHASSSPSTLVSDFKQLAFSTNYKNPDNPRFIIGTNKVLHELSKAWKDPIRYAPNDTIAALDLEMYKFGSMKYVPMSCELFRQVSYLFPADFENRLLVLDLEAINPVCMQGYEAFEMETTDVNNVKNGGYNDFIDWTVQGMISCQVNNPDGHFYIDVTSL